MRRQKLSAVLPVLVLVAVMWVQETLDTVPGVDLDTLGIVPLSSEGLIGIAFAPFLHVGFAHLIANTGAFLVLGALISLTTRHFVAVTVGTILFGGLGTWLIGGPNTIHLGASGVVYGYAAFLVAWGIFNRSILSILVAVAVVIVYGSIAWGVLPTQQSVSWQGHLCGALAGIAMARMLSRESMKA